MIWHDMGMKEGQTKSNIALFRGDIYIQMVFFIFVGDDDELGIYKLKSEREKRGICQEEFRFDRLRCYAL